MACTCRGGEGAQAGVSVVLSALQPVHLPGGVYNYVTGKVHSDLPALRASDAAVVPGAGMGHIAEVVRALTTRGLTTEGRSGEPKGIMEAYKETYTVLLRYSRVETANGVAPVWKRLANANKAEHHAMLQQEFAEVALRTK